LLRDLGALIREHVRFEERTLFPLIEQALSQAELEAVATALAAATTAEL
jgi:hemerythrin-like domain-containing protein